MISVEEILELKKKLHSQKNMTSRHKVKYNTLREIHRELLADIKNYLGPQGYAKFLILKDRK